MSRTGLVVGMGCVMTLSASSARASVQPFDVVVATWPESACLTLVDRSSGVSGVTIDFEILAESPAPGEAKCPDEPEDSRTLQFIALCEERADALPGWIYTDDPGAEVGSPANVLETSELCWTEITDASSRIATTFAATRAPVVWDVADVAAGTYTVWAYTFAPPFTVWSRHDKHVVKVFDGDPDAVGPALAVTDDEVILDLGESTVVEGCIDAVVGTELTGEFATLTSGDWTPFAEGVPIVGGTFSLPFTPGESEAGNTLVIRVTATDPQGRSYTTYSPSYVSVLGEPGECDEGNSFIGCPGGDGDGSSSGQPPQDTSTGGTSTGDANETDGPSADGDRGGCRVGGGGPGLGWMFGLLVVATNRTRRPPRRPAE